MARRIKKKSVSDMMSDYSRLVSETDVLAKTDLAPVLHGLFGEVGGIMSTTKKLVREKSAYPGYRIAAVEEFGDAAWYLSALARRLDCEVGDIFLPHPSANRVLVNVASKKRAQNDSNLAPSRLNTLNIALFELGKAAASLLSAQPNIGALQRFAGCYVEALAAANVGLREVLNFNVKKVRGSFVEPNRARLKDFDQKFKIEEQLPRKFRIRVNQRESGKSYLQWNGVFIGDPLTDNSKDKDGYRFHDVFHFSYAAILHWSPVFRSLIKQKRKSSKRHDEVEDGGRAIVVEEGISAWVFSRAKEMDFFANQTRVSLDMLKTIQQFTKGYEVEDCPPKLWERAILDGFTVFRALKKHKGGWIVGDRDERTITFEPLERTP